MKVNVKTPKVSLNGIHKRIIELGTGAVFIVKGRGAESERTYMKIRPFDRLVHNKVGTEVAVNLITGKLREFPADYGDFELIDPVLATEVIR